MCRSKAAGGRRCPGHRRHHRGGRPGSAPPGQPGSVLVATATGGRPGRGRHHPSTAPGRRRPPEDPPGAAAGPGHRPVRTDRPRPTNRGHPGGPAHRRRPGRPIRPGAALARRVVHRRATPLVGQQPADRPVAAAGTRRTGRPELLEDVHMMSLRQWDNEHGRRVRKGERAIWILAPRTRQIEEEAAHGTRRPAPSSPASPRFRSSTSPRPRDPTYPGRRSGRHR